MSLTDYKIEKIAKKFHQAAMPTGNFPYSFSNTFGTKFGFFLIYAVIAGAMAYPLVTGVSNDFTKDYGGVYFPYIAVAVIIVGAIVVFKLITAKITIDRESITYPTTYSLLQGKIAIKDIDSLSLTEVVTVPRGLGLLGVIFPSWFSKVYIWINGANGVKMELLGNNDMAIIKVLNELIPDHVKAMVDDIMDDGNDDE